MRSALRLGCATALLSAAALVLASCGRVGPLEPPPGPAVSPTVSAAPQSSAPSLLPGDPYSPNSQAAQEKAQKSGFDMYGNPVAPTGQQKTFPLDVLLQ